MTLLSAIDAVGKNLEVVRSVFFSPEKSAVATGILAMNSSEVIYVATYFHFIEKDPAAVRLRGLLL
jgi:hypothetical protein